jgi:DNA-binding NarL/FixJ family response regulator
MEETVLLSSLRISVIERQALVRDALTALLSGAGLHAVIECAEPGPALAKALEARGPDVVLVGAGSVAAVLEQMPTIGESWRTIIVAAAEDTALHGKAIQQGVRGVITPDQPADVIIKAVVKVGAGEYWLTRERLVGVVSTLARVRTAGDPEKMKLMSLTPRERDIVGLVAEGLTNADVAARLSIRETTARNHLTSILDKLELSNRFQLAVYALRRGLVPLPQQSATLSLSGLENAVPVRHRVVR